MRKMAFNVECVRKHLIEKGFVFSVRSYDYGTISHKHVEGVGEVLVKNIGEEISKETIRPFSVFSGFEQISTDVGETRDLWWDAIEKFCKNKPKWLYLVVRVEDV